MSEQSTNDSQAPQQQWAELSQLVNGLAHEIKNPLSTVSMNLKLLSEDLERFDDEDHARLSRRLKHVLDETQRIESILKDFLRFAGKVDINRQPVDLTDLIDELEDFFAPQATACHVVLRTSLPTEPVTCPLDAGLIKQALLNLMINATQAMTPAGGELLLRLGSDTANAILEVIDTGPGMPPEIMENIFNVYWSSKPDGTGLGLPTALRIVRAHQGRLDVDSEVGKGTRFVLTLPLRLPQDATAD